MTYLTQRKIATDCNVSSEVVSRIAGKLGLGISGPAKNSPKTFSQADAHAIGKTIMAEQVGTLRNEILSLEAARFNNACRLAQLAGLAGAMGHAATPELRELAEVVGKVHAGFGKTRPDIKTTAGKTIFLNALKPLRADLDDALRNLSDKL